MSSTTALKLITEIIRATTEHGSTANQVATSAKQALTFLDALTAQNPAQRAQSLAGILSEIAYATSESDKQRQALIVGNALLLALEASQQAVLPENTRQAANLNTQFTTSYQIQSTELASNFEKHMIEHIALIDEKLKLLQHENEKMDLQITESERTIQELKRKLGIL